MKKEKYYPNQNFYIVSAIIIILLGILFFTNNYAARLNISTDSEVSAQNSISTSIPTDISNIVNMYKANSQECKKKYHNKYITITGKITSIEKDLLDQTFLILCDETNNNDSIQCYFSDNHQDQLHSLKTGSHITILGIYYNGTTSPILNNCSITKFSH